MTDDLIALHLQVVNVFLGVQVDAQGFLLDSHDGETHVDAAVQLPFLDLRDKKKSAKVRGSIRDYTTIMYST